MNCFTNYILCVYQYICSFFGHSNESNNESNNNLDNDNNPNSSGLSQEEIEKLREIRANKYTVTRIQFKKKTNTSTDAKRVYFDKHYDRDLLS